VSCPRASGNFGMVEGGWDSDGFEHFPDVMPYTVRSMAWSAKRKRMRTEESEKWQDEMDKLKSQWSGTCGSSRRGGRTFGAEAEEEEGQRAAGFDSQQQQHWDAHREAVRGWEEQRRAWSTDRVKAFHVAQKRLDSFRQGQQSRTMGSPVLPHVSVSADPLGFYASLGLEATASLPEIKAAFRAAAIETHPDVNGGRGSDEKMKLLLSAYEVLKDESKRHLYDRGLVKNLL